MTMHFGVFQLSEAYQEGFVIVAKCKQDSKVLTYFALQNANIP